MTRVLINLLFLSDNCPLVKPVSFPLDINKYKFKSNKVSVNTSYYYNTVTKCLGTIMRRLFTLKISKNARPKWRTKNGQFSITKPWRYIDGHMMQDGLIICLNHMCISYAYMNSMGLVIEVSNRCFVALQSMRIVQI